MLRKLLFVVLLALASVAQATVYSLPWGPRPQFVDANGAPMSGGSLLTFVGSSTTPQVTYTDSTGGVANPTTITLNTRGETPNEVWLTSGVLYKFVLKDAAGSTVWTVDNVAGVNDVTGALDEWKAGPAPTFVSATSFTLAGDQTTTFTVGRRVKTTNSGGTIYSTITASVFGLSTTVTVVNDASVLDSGLSAVSYGLLSAANSSIPSVKLSSGNWSVSNTFTAASSFTASASVTWSGTVSPPQITSNQNDYNPTSLSSASSLRLNTDASRNITGLQGGVSGRIVQIVNVGSFNIVLKNDDGSTSTAANRFQFDADLTLFPNQTASLSYDSTTARWRLMDTTGSPALSFNWTFNTDFRIWGAGTATVPTGWTANGAAASYAKNTTAGRFKWGSAGIDVTRAGTDCFASQSIDTITGFGPVAAWQGKTVTVGAWVYATVASRARLTINDGVGSTNSAYHTGSSTMEFLTVTRVIDSAATKVDVRLGVDTGNTTATFSAVTLVGGGKLSDFIPPGWTGRKAMFGATIATGATQAAGSTTFYKTSGGVGTEGNAATAVPFTRAVVRNLQAIAGGSPGGSETYIVTLRKNSADTTLTCTISAAATTASDTTHEVLYAAGDNYTFKNITSGGASSISGISFSVEIEEVPLP